MRNLFRPKEHSPQWWEGLSVRVQVAKVSGWILLDDTGPGSEGAPVIVIVCEPFPMDLANESLGSNFVYKPPKSTQETLENSRQKKDREPYSCWSYKLFDFCKVSALPVYLLWQDWLGYPIGYRCLRDDGTCWINRNQYAVVDAIQSCQAAGKHRR